MRDLIGIVSGIRKDFEACISGLPIRALLSADMALVLDVYAEIVAIERYLGELNGSVSVDSDFQFPLSSRLPKSVHSDAVLHGHVCTSRTVYCSLKDGGVTVSELLLDSIQRLVGVSAEDDVFIDGQFQSPMALRFAHWLTSVVIFAGEVSSPSIWRGGKAGSDILEPVVKLEKMLTTYLMSAHSGIACDVTISKIVRHAAFLSTYEGRTLNSMGELDLWNTTYI